MIKVIKLITGEEIIGDVSLEDAYVIKTPALFSLARNGMELGVELVPFSPFVKNNTIRVGFDKVVFGEDPTDEVANVYNEQFGSGLVIPPSGLQL